MRQAADARRPFGRLLTAMVTPMRADEPRPFVVNDAVARNAPAWRDGFFVVPKVIGGE